MGIKHTVKELLSHVPIIDGLFRRFVWSRVHFPEVEMRFINSLPSGTVDVSVDVGAALGAYAWILNRVSNQVYAFEPGKIHNQYLRRVVPWTKIKLIRAAVGSVVGNVNLYTPGDDTNARHSATVSESNPVISLSDACVDIVPQVRLDEFLCTELAPGRRVDILKVDVEGYELEVFRGAEQILATHHPLIICEIEARHNSEYHKVFELLSGLGYRCFIYRQGHYESFDGSDIEKLQLQADSNKYINNFVFQHQQSKVKVSE